MVSTYVRTIHPKYSIVWHRAPFITNANPEGFSPAPSVTRWFITVSHVTFINKDDARWLHPSVAVFYPWHPRGRVDFYIPVNKLFGILEFQNLQPTQGDLRTFVPCPAVMRGWREATGLGTLLSSDALFRDLWGKVEQTPSEGRSLLSQWEVQSVPTGTARSCYVTGMLPLGEVLYNGTRGTSWYCCDISR